MALARMTGSARAVCLVLALICLTCGLAADSVEKPTFLADKAFRLALDQKLSGTWEQVDLRTITRRLEETRKVSLLVDRRIDPSRPMKFAAHDVPLLDLLEELAHEQAAEARVVGNTVYLGPRSATDRLRTLVALRTQELASISRGGRGRRISTRSANFPWEDLATPAELVSRLAERDGFQVENPELIPHDLWAAATLPNATLSECLSLILIQFDLTFQWLEGDSGIRIASIPDQVSIEKRYSAPKGSSGKSWLVRIHEQFPDLSARIAGDDVVVAGTVEQHEELDRLKTGKSSAGKTSGFSGTKPTSRDKKGKKQAEIRYTLRMQEKPLGSLLKTLERGEHGGWKFEFDDEELKKAGIRLDQRITFDVRDVAIQELLSTALGQAGLEFEMNERVVRLRAKSSSK